MLLGGSKLTCCSRKGGILLGRSKDSVTKVSFLTISGHLSSLNLAVTLRMGSQLSLLRSILLLEVFSLSKRLYYQCK